MNVDTRRKQAALLLENPVFQELATTIDAEIYAQWAQETAKANREFLWFKSQAIREVLGQLKIMAQPVHEEEKVA